MQDYMLTTYDNIYNPFTEFNAWFHEDHHLGHYTCELLDKCSYTNQMASDEVNEKEIDRAMDEIVENFPLIYRKVLPKDYEKTQ